jgi:hypothetical protein
MSPQEVAITATYRHPPATPKKKKAAPSSLWLILGTLLLASTLWTAAPRLDYTPGSDLGYNLGVAGGIAMLLTLLYPLSKRVRLVRAWVQLKHWFRVHMILGIFGPILILLHSKLSLESINGTLAFCSMWMVFLSGITGRYLHTKIHRTLADKRALLQDLNRQIGVSAADVRSKFHFAPQVNQRLERFQSLAPTQARGILRNSWSLLTLPFRLQWTYARASRDLRRAIKARARKRAWSRTKMRQRLSYGKKMIRAYLEVVRSVARIGGYERLFSLWHFVHVPLLFWLVITGVIHVLAVHMY